ncbi:MAG: zinc metalloprotease HtpX [Candidatus Micrarchaeaceae archaeon]
MASNNITLKMYITLFLIFAIGFAIIYALLTFLGVSMLGIVIFAALFFALQWYAGPGIIKIMARLHYLGKDERKDLQKLVYDVADAANVPRPRIAISPAKDPNAFVFGRTRKSATLVLHQGILDRLNEDELRAVIAHEIGHIKHNDFAVMTFAAFIPMLAYIIAQNLFLSSMFGGGGGRNNSGYLALVGMGAFLVYFIAELLMLSVSRARETLADEHSAKLTKKPEDLAQALVKITYGLGESGTPSTSIERSFYIADYATARRDLKEIEEHAREIKRLLPNISIERLKQDAQGGAMGSIASLFMTHPPTYRRIIDLAKIKTQQE